MELIKRDNIKIKSITSDNGFEFEYWERIVNLLGIDWYFCDPYSSYQHGQNERLNRDLREFFQKGTDFFKFSEKEINHAINEINEFPRRKFNGANANEIEKMLQYKVAG